MIAGLLAVCCVVILAQTASSRVELGTQGADNSIIVHVAVPRGQLIREATLTLDDASITLNPAQEALPVTRWIVLDASDNLINLQIAVQASLQRFLAANEGQTGLVFYGSDVDILRPTDRQSEIDAFLDDYSATANEPGCVWDALAVIAEAERATDASWRVLLISGPLSSQTTCDRQSTPDVPAPVDVIAISDAAAPELQDLAASQNGALLSANLRTVEARINEIRTLWTRPTYALRGDPGDVAMSSEARYDLSLTFDNDLTATLAVRFAERSTPVIAPDPTDIVLATIPPRPTNTAPAAVVPQDGTQAASGSAGNANGSNGSTPPSGTDGNGGAPVNPLMLAGIGIIVLGLVLLVVVLLQQRRPATGTPARAASSENFYASLDTRTPTTVPQGMGRERDTDEWTQIANDIVDEQVMEGDTLPPDAEQAQRAIAERQAIEAARDDEDALLITQVLSDAQFKQMMQADDTNAVVGWLHIEASADAQADIDDSDQAADADAQSDYEVRRPGVTIGRSLDCDIIIRDDLAISRQHAQLNVDAEGHVTISRLSVTNPVVVGGRLVSNNYPLKSNDVIYLSDKTRVVFIANQATTDNPDSDPDPGQTDFDDDDITRL